MKKVRIYWNLHKKCFSVQDYKTGRVIAYKNLVHLTDVKFHVRTGGNQRVRDEGRKNVHAFMIGNLVAGASEFADVADAIGREVTYNPYKYETFVTVCDKEPVMEAYSVIACVDQRADTKAYIPSVFASLPTPNKSNIGLTNQQ